MSEKAAPKQQIYLALAAIISDIKAVEKDKKNEQQGFRFRGIDDVYNALHPIFAAHGVICLPVVESVTYDRIDKAPVGNNPAKSTHLARVVMGYRFTAMDGTYVEAKTLGEGFDPGDKATAKALSVAHKYLLLQTFLIPTADIVDGDLESTADAHTELRNMSEADRARELERQNEVLDAKRQGIKQELADRGLPEGVQTVESPERTPAEKAPKTRTRKPAESTEEPTEPVQKTKAPEAKSQAPAGEPECLGRVIDVINSPKYKGRTVGDLSLVELEKLNKDWVDAFAAQIATVPEKASMAACLKEALAYRQSEK